MDASERRLRASKEAARWWTTLQVGEVPRAEREKFIEWLGESKTHVIEILRIMQVHGTLAQFKEWESVAFDAKRDELNVIPISPAFVVERRLPEERRSAWRGSRLKLAMAAAAGIAALMIGGITLVARWQQQLIATDRGERREVVLEDGSIVQVDPQTRLRVQFEAGVRRLRLLEGRAMFRVAKNPQRPFIVESSGTAVRAVGTAFGVERRPDRVLIVTVAEGKVAIVTEQQEQQFQAAGSTAPGSTALAPGAIFVTENQQVTVRQAQTLVPVQTVDSSQELAWAEGRLVFKDETMANVIAEFNRYNQVQLRVADTALLARRVSGVFDAAYPEEFIAFVKGALPVTIERGETGTITIAPSRPVPGR